MDYGGDAPDGFNGPGVLIRDGYIGGPLVKDGVASVYRPDRVMFCPSTPSKRWSSYKGFNPNGATLDPDVTDGNSLRMSG